MEQITREPTRDRFFHSALIMRPEHHGKMTVLATGQIKAELETLTYTSSLYPTLSFLECKESCSNVLDLCRDMPVDAVVLEAGGCGDILGIDLAKRVQQLDEDINIIFVSDTKRHVWPAFDTGAIGYHTRPLDAARLENTLARAREHDTRLFQYALFDMKKECTDYTNDEYLQFVEPIRNHSIRSARHARALLQTAKKRGLYEEYDTEIVVQAIQNHDIGKERFYSLLRKPYLTKRDRYAVMQHTNLGYHHWREVSAESSETDRQSCTLNADAALTHHERWNGSGYPQGLRGRKIPLIGRICGICIEYDTMITDFGYTPEQAKAVVRREGGNLFDPSLAELFAATY